MKDFNGPVVFREVAFDSGVFDIPFLKLWSMSKFKSCLLRERTVHKLTDRFE